MSPYDVLGVSPEATPAQVRRAYLDLARRHHPDLADGPAERRVAEERMRVVNEAWAALADPARRAAHGGSSAASSVLHDGPRTEWVPVDAELDDPAELADIPYGRGSELPRIVQLLPPVLVLAAVGAGSIALVTGLAAALALAMSAVLLAGVAFVAAPVLAVLRGRQAEARGSGAGSG